MNGLLSKALSETPIERFDLKLANKLSFIQFLVEMCFRYTQDEVLETTREMLMAWQNKQFDWTDDWSAIDDRRKGYRQRFAQSAQSLAGAAMSTVTVNGTINSTGVTPSGLPANF